MVRRQPDSGDGKVFGLGWIFVGHRQFRLPAVRGCLEKTALVEVSVRGVVSRDSSSDSRFRTAASGLYRAEPLFGACRGDWPGAFVVWVVNLRAPMTCGGWVEWIVAVTVAIQRWGRDPVFRGRVCGVEDGRLRLAIPVVSRGFSTSLVCGAAGGWRLVEVRQPVASQARLPWLGWLKGDGGGGRSPGGLSSSSAETWATWMSVARSAGGDFQGLGLISCVS